MDKKSIELYLKSFDEIATYIESEDGREKVEVWFARELQSRLGYSRWENFKAAIGRAIDSCKSLNVSVDDHFRDVTKMVPLGSESFREINDYMLTRYACYLIAMNGDPRKEEIAFAQSYFAVQTRKMELIEERLNLLSRLDTRDRLRASENPPSRPSMCKTIPRFALCLVSEASVRRSCLQQKISRKWSVVWHLRRRRLRSRPLAFRNRLRTNHNG